MFWSKARKIKKLEIALEELDKSRTAEALMKEAARKALNTAGTEVKVLKEEVERLEKARNLIVQEFELKKNDYEFLASTYADTRNVIDSKDRSIEELKRMLEACEAQVRALQKELLESRAEPEPEVQVTAQWNRGTVNRRDEPILQIDEYTGAVVDRHEVSEVDSLFVSKDSGT